MNTFYILQYVIFEITTIKKRNELGEVRTSMRYSPKSARVDKLNNSASFGCSASVATQAAVNGIQNSLFSGKGRIKKGRQHTDTPFCYIQSRFRIRLGLQIQGINGEAYSSRMPCLYHTNEQ